MTRVTEHLTLNTVIHAAVRRDLDRFVRALQGFPAGSRERADQLMTAWRNFHKQLEDHHHGEETIFWPALREVGADESLVGDLGGEHEKMMDELGSVDVMMGALVSDPSEANAQTALSALYDLKAAIEVHFAHEERDLEPFMASKMSTDPLQRALKATRKAHPAAEQGVFMAWLQDGADADARAGLARQIPRPVLFVFTRVLGRSYARDIAPVWS
jgi:hypothetical protein